MCSRWEGRGGDDVSFFLLPKVPIHGFDSSGLPLFFIYTPHRTYLGYECGYDISYILYSIPRMPVSN